MGVAGQVYSYAQLKQLWINAGGSSAIADVMAAIALAESSGGASSTNANTDGSTDYGLWQINSANGATTSLFDPTLNAQAAVRIYQQQGLGAWTTYTSGDYSQYLQNGTPASGTLPVSNTTPTDGVTPAGYNPLNPLGSLGGDVGKGIANAIAGLLAPFMKIAIWGFETILGVVIMVISIVIIMQQSNTVKNVEKTGARLGLDAASVVEPEAAPELQMEKRAIPKATKPEPKDPSIAKPSRKAVSRAKREESYGE